MRHLPPSILIDSPAWQVHLFRKRRVILDSDLARFYGIPVRVLNQCVSRNRRKFLFSEIFKLTAQEWDSLRSQSVISNGEAKARGGRRSAPLAFTRRGVALVTAYLRHPRVREAQLLLIERGLSLGASGTSSSPW